MPLSPSSCCDVLIIGAGPSGAIAAARLSQAGQRVVVLEKDSFPRFVIGESLLPQAMEFIEKAGLLQKVVEAGCQFKNGATFRYGDQIQSIDFRMKFGEGWGTTYQVRRAEFDQLLIDGAAGFGAHVHYRHEVTAVDFSDTLAMVSVRNDKGEIHEWHAGFVLDASGYGRVLPRLLGLDRPSSFPVRRAVFTHVRDQLYDKDFEREKILITIHPEQRDIWYWLIPFSDQTSSIGVVARPEVFDGMAGSELEKLQTLIAQAPALDQLLKDATPIRDTATLKGYSSNVSTLHGKNFALLGNAGEFLDPVFSSGVTIAMKSADLAANLLIRQYEGQHIDWDREYAQPLMTGVNCFRSFVESWYDGSLQDIILNPPREDNDIKRMITAILAGYAWNEKNPFVSKSRRYLEMVATQCG